MTASAFDSALFRDSLFDRDTAALFTDTAEVRAMMIVIGALAKAGGQLGEVPEIAAGAIHRASLELQIDPASLSKGVAAGQSAASPLIDHFRELMQAPEYAPHVGQGATPEEIEATALALRLRQFLSIATERLEARSLPVGLDDLADRVQVVHMPDSALRDTVAQGLGLKPADTDPQQALHDLSDWITAKVALLVEDEKSLSVAHLVSGLNTAMRAATNQPEAVATTRLCLPQMVLALGHLLSLEK